MDDTDRIIINRLQEDFPLVDRPFRQIAAEMGLEEEALLALVIRLRQTGVLTRFGPLFHAERMGGSLTLAAMAVPLEAFEAVAAVVNAFTEVAHNYQRDHTLNMWFVLATETPERYKSVIKEIEQRTGYPVYDMPKISEYFIGVRFEA